MIHVAIVEDDPKERERFSSYLDVFANKNDMNLKVDSFASAEPFLNSDTSSFDIVLMDIELPGINGMNACHELRKANKNIIIIFITNMASFAIKGYEVDAMDFVLKPVRQELFEAKISKAISKISTEKTDKISFSINRTTRIFLLSDILYFEVLDHNTCIHTIGGSYMTRCSLNKIEKELDGKDFYRCSNYCIINLKHVKEVLHDNVLIGNDEIKLSRSKKKDFSNRLCEYLGRA